MKIKYRIAPGFEELEKWIKNLPYFFSANGISLYKDRNEVKVFKEIGFELNVKSFKIPNIVNRFAYVYIRGSKADRSFQNAMRFLDAGAATPTPVAFVECITNCQLAESFYLSLNYPYEFNLHDVLSNKVSDKENIIRQWVQFTWQKLHRAGIFHQDYSPGNTLIKNDEGKYNFSIIDLNRMRFTSVGFELGIQNFRQLDTNAETLELIASEYAKLCGESCEKACSLLLSADKKNKDFRRMKGKLKNLFK